MAVVSLSVTFYDNKGAESIVTLYTSDSYSIITLGNALRSLVPILGNLTNGGLRPKASITVTVDLTTAPSYATYQTPSLGSDVEEGAFYEFLASDPNSIKKGRIPTFDEGFILTGTREVDTSQTEWIAFQTAMLSGLATTDETASPITVLFNDRYGNDLVGLLQAYEQFKSSRKRA